jgi:hypothetical protein
MRRCEVVNKTGWVNPVVACCKATVTLRRMADEDVEGRFDCVSGDGIDPWWSAAYVAWHGTGG